MSRQSHPQLFLLPCLLVNQRDNLRCNLRYNRRFNQLGSPQVGPLHRLQEDPPEIPLQDRQGVPRRCLRHFRRNPRRRCLLEHTSEEAPYSKAWGKVRLLKMKDRLFPLEKQATLSCPSTSLKIRVDTSLCLPQLLLAFHPTLAGSCPCTFGEIGMVL